MMSPTKLVWVGIIVDLILVSHAKPAWVNVDLDVNIKSPKANQAPLDGSSDREALEGPQMHSRHSDILQKTGTPEQIEDIKKAAGSRKASASNRGPIEWACKTTCKGLIPKPLDMLCKKLCKKISG